MCTRFVFKGEDVVTGFNFEIDLSDWTHKVIKEKDRFYIGIQGIDGEYHSYHGINRNGNVGTLLYVHGNENANYTNENNSITIADLTESFIKNEISFDKAVEIVKNKKVVYAIDATMQALLSDKNGRVLIIEPGIGYRVEESKYSIITNYSVLNPESTKEYINPGDIRYEMAKEKLSTYENEFSPEDAMSILKYVSQDNHWATRVSFVYSAKNNKVFYVENNKFNEIKEYSFI